MTKIDTTMQTGKTSVHKRVRSVSVTLSKYKFDFTILYLLLRRSKCIYRTSDLEFGLESYDFRKF